MFRSPQSLAEGRSDLSRCPVAMARDQPLLVVSPLELPQGLDQLGDAGEVPNPERVLLEGANEPFGDPIAFRLSCRLVQRHAQIQVQQ
jgi:hypothetical protein